MSSTINYSEMFDSNTPIRNNICLLFFDEVTGLTNIVEDIPTTIISVMKNLNCRHH